MKRIAIFGAGVYGKKALQQYGADKVACFLDNSPNKQGTIYCGIPIVSLETVISEISEYHIIIASTYAASIVNQLQSFGIEDYSFFVNQNHGYYETDSLIVNPYENQQEASSEKEWNGSEKLQYSRKAVFDEVEKLYQNQPMFNHIEIETINRCNGSCSFCPVNRNVDPREKTVMSEILYRNIVDQLAEIHYNGRFTTFSNNEPLLDGRIIDFNRYAREKLPEARIHMFTNGTLLTLDRFLALADILDELIIDNYQQDLKLIKPCEEVKKYCDSHPEIKKKVTIVLRKPKEILTSRGGTAPNRSELMKYKKDRCVLPFKQIIIRPDGKISLCCNDAIGKYTLGDLNKDKILDIWYGPKFQMVRKCLYEGRAKWGNCEFCDTFSMG